MQPAPAVDRRLEIARAFLGAAVHQDWSGAGDLLTDNVTWTMPGTHALSGTARGKTDVLARARKIVGYGTASSFESAYIGTSAIAIQLHNTGRRGSLTLDEHLLTMFEFESDKISAISTLLSDVPMANAYFQ